MSDGTYRFRAYNISDVLGIQQECEKKYYIELDSWGSVFLTTEQVVLGNKILPGVYLTNSNNDVLYKFAAPFKVGTEVSDVVFEDVNSDGLMDIKIYTAFIEDKTIEDIEWVCCQMDGAFYSLELCGE